MEIDVQRLRNLTTGRLHTEMGCIYEDLGLITGQQGLMTHMLPRAAKAIQPWLKEHVKDARFWEDKHDTSHVGTIELPDPTEEDRQAMEDRYFAQPNPLEGKDTLVIGI